MKLMRAIATIGVSAALIAASGVAAASASDDDDALAEVVSIAASPAPVLEDAAPLSVDTVVPTEDGGSVLVSSARPTVQVAMPIEGGFVEATYSAESAVDVVDVVDGQVAYDGDGGNAYVVDANAGSVRFRSASADASALDALTYEVGGDVEVVFDADGAALLALRDAPEESTIIVGQVADPWAFDANGAELQTWYEPYGDGGLRQIVIHDESTAFPVVADPRFVGAPGGFDVLLNSTETRNIANLGPAEVVGGTAAVAGLCGAITSAAGGFGTAIGTATCVLAFPGFVVAAGLASQSGTCIKLQVRGPSVLALPSGCRSVN